MNNGKRLCNDDDFNDSYGVWVEEKHRDDYIERVCASGL